MILALILALALFFACVIFVAFGGLDSIPDAFLAAIVSTGVFVLVAGIGLLIVVGVAGNIDDNPEIEVITHELISIRNDSKTSGSFFLGSGYIDDVEYYFAFQKRDDGGLVRIQIPASRMPIYEDDEKTPSYQYSKYRHSCPWWLGWGTWESLNRQKDAKVYVPVGTVIQKFELR